MPASTFFFTFSLFPIISTPFGRLRLCQLSCRFIPILLLVVLYPRALLAALHTADNMVKQASPPATSTCCSRALRLEWEDLCCRTKSDKSSSGREILSHVSGQAKPGRLLAIMGPSGSGKTTLLNTLSGQLPYSSSVRLTGQVFITEEDTGSKDAADGSFAGVDVAIPGREGESGNSGFVFVKQEDLFYSQLTVRETLLFTARLRLSKRMKDGEKRAYVEEMMARMGLADVAETMVGDEKQRGISGGERKRLSLACELMGNPSKIIFADEPTSGLDSFQSQSVVSRLKRLCHDPARHTVVVSIHQPRNSVYAMFDDIILLSDGHVIYHGPAEKATEHFARLGYVCPPEFNPSEWMLDLVSVDHSSPSRRQESQQRVKELVRAYQEEKDTGETSAVSPPHLSSQKQKLLRSYQLANSLSARRALREHHPSWFAQFCLLIARQWKQTSRDLFTNGLRALTSVLLAGMFGSIFHRLDRGEDGISERSAVLMHTCINTAMIAMVKTLNLFTRERVVVGREQTKKLYSTSSYVLSKVIGELPVDAFFPVVFGCILYPMVGLQAHGQRFARFLGILVLQTLTSSALGLTIGSLCPSTEAALTLGPSIMVVFILLSGQVGTSNSKIPPFLRWVQHISLIRWAFEALCLNEFQGLTFTVPSRSPLRVLRRLLPPFLPPAFRRALPSPLVPLAGAEVLKRLDMDPARTSMGRAVRAQSLILLGNYLLTYAGLRFHAPRFQPIMATSSPPASGPLPPSHSTATPLPSLTPSPAGRDHPVESRACRTLRPPTALSPPPPSSSPLALSTTVGGARSEERRTPSLSSSVLSPSTPPPWWKRRRSRAISAPSPPVSASLPFSSGEGGRKHSTLKDRTASWPKLFHPPPR